MNILNKQALVHQDFVNAMIFELNANVEKGNWLEFTNLPPIKKEIFYHLTKLEAAEREEDKSLIREHIADVANLLMMLGNAHGVYETE